MRASNPSGSPANETAGTLLWASALAFCCVLSVVIGLIDLGGRNSWPTGRLLAYNAAFITTGIAALACLAVAWRRRSIAMS
jgi:hypothetical protein